MKNKTILTVTRNANQWVISHHSNNFPEISVDALTLLCTSKTKDGFAGYVIAVYGLDMNSYKKMNREQLSYIGVKSHSGIFPAQGKTRHGLLYLNQDGTVTSV